MAKMIRDFKDIEELEKSFEGANANEPNVLIKNKMGQLVLIPFSDYDKLLYEKELSEGLERAEQQLKDGEYSDAFEFLEELKQKYEL